MSATLTEENPVLHRAQLESELEILKARLSTVKAENTILRQRHGLPASSETDANNSQLTTADGSDTKPSRSNSQPQDRSVVANKRRKLIVEVVLDSTRIDRFRQETLSRKRSKAPTAGIIPRDAQGDVRIKVEPEEWKTIKTEQEIDSLLVNLIPDEKKIKIEEDAPRLSRDSIRARLALINYAVWDVSLGERIRNVPVSRAFMTEYYGGNTQDTCPKIKRSRVAIHGLKDFMYLNLELNPYAPKSPGDPGFFFALELKSENMNEVKRVFVRLDRNKWLYVGHYKFVPADPLTIDEWNGQSRAVKRKWSENCHVKKWGHRARARIFLRRQADGEEPTDEEVEEVLSRESDKHHRIDVSVEEITQALDEGRERIEVWCMKCVGYAEGFQEYIARESATWIAPPPKRKPAQIGSPRAARSPRKAKTGQKRRREDSEERSLAPESEGEAGESESEPGNDSDEVQEVFRPTRELRYVPTGTRSRPQSMKIKTEI